MMRRYLALPLPFRVGLLCTIGLLLLLLAGPVHADLVLKNKQTGAELRLLDTPCSHGETLTHLKDEWRPRFKNARVLNGKGHIEVYGCWIAHDGEVGIIVFQDGSDAAVKLSAFSDPTV